ncbi:MAG: DUF507 family protein [Thermodesulfovibrionia bacterium]|nr:MAG: DUF507 family protein [Thermodesulfovibrionia bacterium]
MRVSKERVSVLANEITRVLCEKKLIGLKNSQDDVIKLTNKLIFDELIVEEQLNREVREFLKKYDVEIEKGRLDYRRLFELTKQKLVKEKNIIL